MRYLGAAILVMALTAIGIFKSVEVRKRLTVMQGVSLMLEIIKAELSTNRTPVNKIFDRINSCCGGDIQYFAELMQVSMGRLGENSFSNLWSSSVEEAFAVLPTDCLTELISLGASLGKYDADMQLEAIDRCRSVLAAGIDELRPQTGKMQKMYIGLYGGVGLIAAVMLI